MKVNSELVSGIAIISLQETSEMSENLPFNS